MESQEAPVRDVAEFELWRKTPKELPSVATSTNNYAYVKLGAALNSAYTGLCRQDSWLLIQLFREYWEPELKHWMQQHRKSAHKGARLVLWARSGSMQTADLLAKSDALFAGQNFEDLTSLLCNKLFKDTADGGTWFWPQRQWVQDKSKLTGGQRAIWACYSASLVQAAASVLYQDRLVPAVLEAVVFLYGSDAETLWADYEDTKAASILFNEECFAGRGCPDFEPLATTVVYLIVPPTLFPSHGEHSLRLDGGSRALPPGWSVSDSDVVRRITANVALHWQSSPMSRNVQVILHPNCQQNIDNYEACVARVRSKNADASTWPREQPTEQPMIWLPVNVRERVTRKGVMTDPVGSFALFEGQVCQITMVPDHDDNIKLRYVDETTSDYIARDRLAEATEEQWAAAKEQQAEAKECEKQAKACMEQGQHVEAVELFEACATIQKEVLGEENPSYKQTVRNIVMMKEAVRAAVMAKEKEVGCCVMM